MDNIFNIRITDRIEISSNYSFDKELEVIVSNSTHNILYRTNFLFKKDFVYWIGLNQLENIIINILSEDRVIYKYENIDNFAYVTCGDIYYMDLVEKLVVSLLNVSNNKIIVYGINCKVPFDYPNLIKREIISPIKSEHDKWFWKQQVCIESLKENFSNYVWIDGDVVVNTNIDTVSSYFNEIDNYPLGDVHIHDEQVFYTAHDNKTQLMCEKICKYYNIPRKVLKKDLHACFFVYNKKCKWFFEEILDTYHTVLNQGLYDELLKWNDENLHNFMHNKHNLTKTLPLSNLSLICNHSKYYSNPQVLNYFYSYWFEDGPNNFGQTWGFNYYSENKNQVLYFHENKNLKDADEMIEFVKMKKNDNFNSSKWFFINKYKMRNFEKERYDDELNKNYDNSYKLFEYKDLLNLSPGDVVIDIGADIGFFERYCYLKNASKIICFEPDKDKFELLKLNSYKKTELFNADISDNSGEYIIEKENGDIKVRTYNISYLFDAELIDKIDFLKIDNKGKEVSIINGIRDEHFNRINKISIKWYNFTSLGDENMNEKVTFFLKKGLNCFINQHNEFTMLYLYRK